MDFNNDTGRIFGGIQTIDPTLLPPLGGIAGVLTIEGTGALTLPNGTTLERPTPSLAAMLRYNGDLQALEYHNSTTWVQLSVGGGTVTSVAATTTGAGISVTGSPIVNSGTLTFSLSSTLQGLSTIGNTSGIVVQTSPDVFTERTITGTLGNVVVTNGDGVEGNINIDLDTVGTPVTSSFVKITTDVNGRVTATTPVVSADITTLVDAVYVNVTGDTMSGDLTFTAGSTVTGLPTPVNGSDAVSKSYADALVQGLSFKQAVSAATTADIVLSGEQTIDGVVLVAGERVLVKNQDDDTENGIYIVDSSNWVRSTDADTGTELVGAYVFVSSGTNNDNTSWAQISPAPITVGSSAIVWNQFSGAGSYTAGTGLSVSGTEFSLQTPVTTVNGGTGTNSAPTAGQVLIGTSSGTFTPALIGNGSGIDVTSGNGAILIDNTGALSFNTRTGNITLTSGDVTTALGYTPVNKAGDTMTGSLIVTGAVTATNTDSSVTLLGGATNGAPVTITAVGTGPNTGIDLVTQGAGNATVNGNTILTTASQYVQQIVAGSNVTISPIGGSGVVTINATGNVTSLIAGDGISVSSSTGDITISNTGVTSVALSDASTLPIFSISGSPVTTTGTLTQTLVSQPANTAFLSPDGTTGQPSFRAVAYNDLPIKLYVENPQNTPVLTASANNAQAFGDGASASLAGSKAFANGAFAAPGDAQHGLYVLRNLTTDATATELFLDGNSLPLVIPDNSVVVFDILVAGRRTDAVGGGAGYRFAGVARKDSTSGSLTFVGVPSKTILGETDMPWDATLTANIVNGALQIEVFGQAAKTIRWVATVQTTEVTN